MKTISKENINPLCSSEDYSLRKTIPLKLSSILKSSNAIESKQTLAEVTTQYEMDKEILKNFKAKTPLIKIDEQKSKNTSIFLKNARNSIKIAPKFVKDQSLIIKQSQIQKLSQNTCNEEDRLDQKLMELISMIDNKQPNRCHSSKALNANISIAPINNILSKIDAQIPLPSPIEINQNAQCPQTPVIRVKTPSFLFRPSTNLRCSEQIEVSSRNQLTKSSYFASPSHVKANEQRMSYYEPAKKTQTYQMRLCINCQSYVNIYAVSQHQQKCPGFKMILKMSNQELLKFLDEKIQIKLNQLHAIQTKINDLKKQSFRVGHAQILNLSQKRVNVDQVLNDLDAIRLKALKKLYSKKPKTKKLES